MWRMNRKGISLVETLIAVSIMGIIAFASSELYQYNVKLQMASRSLAEFSNITSELRTLTKQLSACRNSYRDTIGNVADYNPAGNPTYTRPINYVFFGNKLLLAVDGQPTPPAFDSSLSDLIVNSITLRSKGLPTTSTSINSGGSLLAVNQHFVDLVVDMERPRAGFGRRQLVRTIPVTLYTDPSTHEILGCASEFQAGVETAIASRRGITFHGHSCTDTISPEDYQASACTDSDYDGFCDSADWTAGDPIHKIPHRLYDEYTNATTGEHGDYYWPRYFPVRDDSFADVPPAPITTPDEGRCWVQVEKVPSGQEAQDIFVLYNEPGVWTEEGIGCNRSRGWFLTTCIREDAGYGATDVKVKQVNGNEICVTSDFQRPHAALLPWKLYIIRMTAVCMRVSMEN